MKYKDETPLFYQELLEDFEYSIELLELEIKDTRERLGCNRRAAIELLRKEQKAQMIAESESLIRDVHYFTKHAKTFDKAVALFKMELQAHFEKQEKERIEKCGLICD